VIPLSSELWLDSSPSALDAVGRMIAKAMATKQFRPPTRANGLGLDRHLGRKS
jgi:hypothetical protein